MVLSEPGRGLATIEVDISFGGTVEKLALDARQLVGVLNPKQPVGHAEDRATLIRQALDNPISSPRLESLARGKTSAALIISDHTRPAAGSGRLVGYLLERLERGGLPRDGVTVVVALGLHAAPPDEALADLLGPDLASEVKAVFHNPDACDLVDLGHTPTSGIPFSVNRVVYEADLRVSVGQIEPHGCYGWSGGAKHVLPGVAGRRTISEHHGRPAELGGLGLLDGNVFRADAEEAAAILGQDFILNVILDERNDVIKGFAGHYIEAHRAAAVFASSLKTVSIPRPVEVVVAALGGPPRDSDFWQSQGKGIRHAAPAVADGGVMILAAGCRDGIGPDDYRHLLRLDMARLRRMEALGVKSAALGKCLEIVSFLERARLLVVSPGLSQSDFPHLPIQIFSTVREALAEALRQTGPHSRVLVMPDSARAAALIG